ncbi:MAG TPA: hypothetical protein VHY20_11655 [Pirellulales bacterium]|jgi:hypothetical protein|nr:hypothetical protein [Pirellulales bacterium]
MLHEAKKWLLAALVMVAIGGGALVLNTATSQNAAAQGPPPADQWRNHDGHWSFYHAGDKRWYYTDGKHWYFHNGLGWALYPFDKLFGRDFVHGDYKVPPHDRVEVPHHSVFHY